VGSDTDDAANLDREDDAASHIDRSRSDV